MEEILIYVKSMAYQYGLKILIAIVIFAVGKYIARFLKMMVTKLLEKGKVEKTLTTFISSLVYYLALAFVVIAALGQVGVQTASLVAILGAAGLAVGLALQGSLANFAAGVLIILFKPFKVGDFIEAGGATGTVRKITIFTTELVSPDNKIITVPNSSVMGGNITNFSAEDKRRLDLVIGVGYNDSLDEVKKILTSILSEHKKILKSPEPTIGVLELADSSVNFAVRPWVKTGDYWTVYFELMETIKKKFDEHNISIPYPQMDVHVEQVQN